MYAQFMIVQLEFLGNVVLTSCTVQLPYKNSGYKNIRHIFDTTPVLDPAQHGKPLGIDPLNEGIWAMKW